MTLTLCVVCGDVASFRGEKGWYCMRDECRRKADITTALRVTAHVDEARGMRPDPTAGAIRGGEYDVRDREGGESWEHHEPRRAQTLHYDSPIMLGGEEWWQRSPTVYSHTAPMCSPRTAKRVARELTESEAQRRSLAMVMVHATDDAAGLAPWEVAERVGVTRPRATRANKGHSRR